jgi:hypothetical protein
VPPAQVLAVYGRGSQWTGTFLNHLASSGLGNASNASLGYLLSGGGNQLKPMPWSSVDVITLEFDRAVPVTQGDLTLVGSRDAATAPPAITSFAWDPVRFTATWGFAAALAPNKYLLHLNPTVVSGFGSGDGVPTFGAAPAASEFNFRFNTLPGDVDGSASVAFGEIGQMRLKLGLAAGSAGYDPRQDWDGSGSITFADIGQARLMLGMTYASFAEPEPPISTGGMGAAEATAAEAAVPATVTVTTETAAAFVAAAIEAAELGPFGPVETAPAATLVEASGSISFASVSYGAASIGEVSIRNRDLLRPSVDRSLFVPVAPRFERLSTAVARATSEFEPETGMMALAAGESGLRIGATHLNWRRLRRAAAEPTGGKWGLAGGE